ncbi:hypothetical protein [Streptomyces sp. NPDC058045]|uniref:hypothetical protein n=1 Tax=Streptomyces sp. NPDC058045 TaxID=3346311 RepID=UPI0036E9D5F6
MTRWADDEQAREPRGEQSLAVDMLGVGPASTPARELLASVSQIGAVALLVFVLFPDRVPERWRWMVVGATVAYFVFRTAAGIPKWRRR